jgi:putative transcriptional regulator
MRKVQARLERDGSVTSRGPEGIWQRVEPRADWTRVDATTEPEISRQIAKDEAAAIKAAALWARRVRRRTGLSQAEFSRRIGVSVAMIGAWEHGQKVPRGAARAAAGSPAPRPLALAPRALRVIDRMPEAALAALAA